VPVVPGARVDAARNHVTQTTTDTLSRRDRMSYHVVRWAARRRGVWRNCYYSSSDAAVARPYPFADRPI